MNEKHEPLKMSDEGKDETLFNFFLQETNFSGGPSRASASCWNPSKQVVMRAVGSCLKIRFKRRIEMVDIKKVDN